MLEGDAKTDINLVRLIEPDLRGSQEMWMWAVGPRFYFRRAL